MDHEPLVPAEEGSPADATAPEVGIEVAAALEEEFEAHAAAEQATEAVTLPGWATEDEPGASRTRLMEDVVGPVLPWLRLVAVAMLLLQVGVLALGWRVSACMGAGYAAYPLWIWAVVLPVAILRLHVEWRALKLYLPVYVQGCNEYEIGGFTVLGRKAHFVSWLAFYVVCSNLNVVDLGMDSLFTATVQRTLQCPEVQIEEVWAKVWTQSMFGKFHAPVPSMQLMVLGSCALSLLQMVVPIVQTADREALGCKADGEKLYKYQVLCLLSESAGLASLQSLALPRSQQVIRLWKRSGSWSHEFMAKAAQTVGRGFASRVLLSYLLENCLQANLQTTLFAINRSVVGSSGTRAQLQALASIALSILMTFLKLSEAKEFLSAAPKIIEEVGQIPDRDTTSLELMRQFNAAVRAVKVGCVCMVLLLGYASCKLAAAFWCQDAVWNVTGCVDLSA